MSRTLRRSLPLALTCAVLVAGCATGGGPVAPTLTPLQLRELQTRDFEAEDEQQVTRAALQALQDEGFMIGSADARLGVITAVRELTEQRRGSRFSTGRLVASVFTYGAALLIPPSEKTFVVRLEATISVAPHGSRYRVRASLVYRRTDDKGMLVESRPVEDPLLYQSLFETVGKALFLARERV